MRCQRWQRCQRCRGTWLARAARNALDRRVGRGGARGQRRARPRRRPDLGRVRPPGHAPGGRHRDRPGDRRGYPRVLRRGRLVLRDRRGRGPARRLARLPVRGRSPGRDRQGRGGGGAYPRRAGGRTCHAVARRADRAVRLQPRTRVKRERHALLRLSRPRLEERPDVLAALHRDRLADRRMGHPAPLPVSASAGSAGAGGTPSENDGSSERSRLTPGPPAFFRRRPSGDGTGLGAAGLSSRPWWG